MKEINEKSWEKELKDIHSGICVLMHSTLGFPEKGESASSVWIKLQEHLIPFIRSAITSSNKALIEKILEKQSNWGNGKYLIDPDDIQAIKASLEE